MKNALILHGTSGSSQHNWFPWLKKQLEDRGYEVWVPDLPGAEKPNVKRYNKFLLGNNKWQFDKNSIIIGHSSGSVAILSLLQHLPAEVKVDTCYLIGSFKDNLAREDLEDLFLEPFDFEKIKSKAKKFVFIHSDNDPYCPLEDAQYLAGKVAGELVVKKGQAHFSIGTAGEKYKEFPFLLELITENQK